MTTKVFFSEANFPADVDETDMEGDVKDQKEETWSTVKGGKKEKKDEKKDEKKEEKKVKETEKGGKKEKKQESKKEEEEGEEEEKEEEVKEETKKEKKEIDHPYNVYLIKSKKKLSELRAMFPGSHLQIISAGTNRRTAPSWSLTSTTITSRSPV